MFRLDLFTAPFQEGGLRRSSLIGSGWPGRCGGNRYQTPPEKRQGKKEDDTNRQRGGQHRKVAGDGACDHAAYQRSNRISDIEDGINRRVGAGGATVHGVSKFGKER